MDGINFEELLRSLLVLGNLLQAGLIIVALIGGRFVRRHRLAWFGEDSAECHTPRRKSQFLRNRHRLSNPRPHALSAWRGGGSYQ